jgi:hypothetical protein
LEHSVEHKRRLIKPGHEQISVRRQCELLELHRSNLVKADVHLTQIAS